MRTARMRRIARAVLGMALLVAGGCLTAPKSRPYREPPPPDIKTTRIDYVDTDAFDTLLETALTTQDPVILIQTAHQKPDWGGRLNGWIAAWNLGGKVDAANDRRTLRFQLGLSPVTVDAGSIREFRLLITDLMDRVEVLARDSSAWWAEERTRNRRVALLKPYNIRFNLDSDKNIQIIFFNGRYFEYYRDFMQGITGPEPEEPQGWVRGYTCSQCKAKREAASNDAAQSEMRGIVPAVRRMTQVDEKK
jgi:hypothetical protein